MTEPAADAIPHGGHINRADLNSANIDQLEKMLADAQQDLRDIRAELAERRAQQRHDQMAAMPDDLNRIEGHWRYLITHLREIIKD